MIDWGSAILAGVTFFAVAVSPGPATLSNATIAMRYGFRASVSYGLGLSVAIALWGLLAATGMGAVLMASVYVLSGLKIAGGLYLLWLAWQSGLSALRASAIDTRRVGEGRWFLRGLVLNLSNPKTVIAWLAALAIGATPGAGTGAVVASYLSCVCAAFLCNLLYSVGFSRAGMMALYRRFHAWIDCVAAGLFALGGLALIRSALQRAG